MLKLSYPIVSTSNFKGHHCLIKPELKISDQNMIKIASFSTPVYYQLKLSFSPMKSPLHLKLLQEDKRSIQ